MHGLGFLFWACVIGLVLVWSPDAATAEDTVAVPKSQLAALQVEHANMRKLIDEQQEALRKLSAMAGNCLASESWLGEKWR
jgi:hypothetical protein